MHPRTTPWLTTTLLLILTACQSVPIEPRSAESAPVTRDAPRLFAPAPVMTHAIPLTAPLAARHASQPESRERYGAIVDGAVRVAAEAPVSTFAVDADGGGYANVRRILREGRLPPHDAVRIEEMINYFPFDLRRPQADEAPLALTTEVSVSPWNPDNLLLRIGIKGRDLAKDALPPASLVFLIDVSGSMTPAERLPLIQASLRRFVRNLRAQDRIAIVTYADDARITLAPVAGDRHDLIEAAIDSLRAGGSTNGGSGIDLAYRLAHEQYRADGINRILLATDGDFNVGETSFAALRDRAARERKTGISLSTLGVGRGNLNEHLMEQLANSGDGQYSYLDTLNEGYKVLVDEFTSTLGTIARDVKVQVEFNPAAIREYRLLGYENRSLRREDFRNAAVDGGEIGAGHTVTAIYEITPAGSRGGLIEPSRYATVLPAAIADRGEIAHVRIRYRTPRADAETTSTLAHPVVLGATPTTIAAASREHRFAIAVAAFGQLLRGGRHTGRFGFRDVHALASEALGADPFEYRREFLTLVRLACRLTPALVNGDVCPTEVNRMEPTPSCGLPLFKRGIEGDFAEPGYSDVVAKSPPPPFSKGEFLGNPAIPHSSVCARPATGNFP